MVVASDLHNALVALENLRSDSLFGLEYLSAEGVATVAMSATAEIPIRKMDQMMRVEFNYQVFDAGAETCR